LKLKWESILAIPRIQVPIQFFVGTRDEIVPSFHVDLLRKAAIKAEFVEYYEVEGGTHNDTWYRGG
jgi:fermentation-respiration switch protein FrsA (DUF1100 family)